MTAPIGLQLYTLRDALKDDFNGVIEYVAQLGYAGVETARNYGSNVEETARFFKSLGLEVSSAHEGIPNGDQKNQILDTLNTLSCPYLIVPWLPPERFASADGIKGVADELNQADANARERGISLGYHNHWFEFEVSSALGGRTPFEVLLDHVAPTVQFELDTYWIKTGGSDPVHFISQLGARVPLLHIKDGPAVRGEPMVAVGDGVIDVPAIIKAGEGNTKWQIVELDQCATDMKEAVAKSYKYLTEKGLARGKR